MQSIEKEEFIQMTCSIFDLFVKKKQNRERMAQFIWDTIARQKKEYAVYVLYELLVEWTVHPQLTELIEKIQMKKVGWNHPTFKKLHQLEKEQDDFLSNPPKLEEGVIECRKCGSRKTYSFSKQTRRADESCTVFVRCSQCNSSFRM
jgi:DNA-directed RNA polymerase subunit M/transcription elongation factor TFIIS